MTSKERREAPLIPRLAFWGLFTASLFSFLGAEWIWFSFFSHFQAYLCVAWLGFLLVFRSIPAFPRAFWHPKRVIKCGFILALCHACFISSLFFSSSTPDLEGPTEVDILWFNMMYNKNALLELEERIAKDPPDILALGEIGPKMEVSLPGYPYQIRSSKDGLLVVSRFPLEGGQLIKKTEKSREQITARVAVGRRRFDLVAVHLRHPIYPTHFQEFAQLTESALDDEEAIFVGDFNCTVWAAQFRHLMRDADMRHGREGRGIQNTWAIPFATWLPLPIDHMVYKGDIALTELKVLDWTSSDHRPIRGKFLLGGKLRRKVISND